MSMINDALRRASSAAKSAPPALPAVDSQAAPPPVPPMPGAQHALPAPPTPPPLNAAPFSAPPLAGFNIALQAPPLLRVQPPRKPSVLPVVLITLLVFCLAGAAAVFFWQKSHRLTVSAIEKADEEPTDSEFVAALLGDEKARAKIAATADVTNVPVPVPSTPPVASPSAVAVTAISAAAPTAPRLPVKFPPLRLQSIFYRPSNPSVIINGKTLFVSDDIDGVNVADIQPASVTLVLSGQTNVLTLR
jgi:hypothetical protein